MRLIFQRTILKIYFLREQFQESNEEIIKVIQASSFPYGSFIESIKKFYYVFWAKKL